MSTDYGQKERQFLVSLKADTGRDLGEWMDAISAEGLERRNDIIDWLRRQGFMFSKASWLERIHHNCGRPIYDDAHAKRPPAARRRDRAPPAGGPAVSAALVSASPGDTPQSLPSIPPLDGLEKPDAGRDMLEQLLAKAKALRPLALFVLREVAKAVPGARLRPDAAYVSIARAREFAVLALSPRELRLGLVLGETPFDRPLEAARFPPASRISASITHMIVLTDARQVNERLLALVKEAAARC